MPRKKSYISHELDVDEIIEREQRTTSSSRLNFEEIIGASGRIPTERGVDLSRWLNNGIDDWVYETIKSLKNMARAGTHECATLIAYGRAAAGFFEFLTGDQSHPVCRAPEELRPSHLIEYIYWLKRTIAEKNGSVSSARNNYQSIKGILVQLAARGKVKIDRQSFPVNAFPQSNRHSVPTAPYSESEQLRIAAALRADLIDLHHGRLHIPAAEAAVIHYLVVAMRSGCNTTPLLELERDAIKPGLLPGFRHIHVKKYRSRRVHSRALRREPVNEAPNVLPLDAVAVLERALAASAHLVVEAPEPIKNRVWLFQHQAGKTPGKISCLKKWSVWVNAAKIVNRHGLLADSGAKLSISPNRFRQSIAARAWRLSGGDNLDVAAILGNTPHVADENYLRVTTDILEISATFFDKDFTARLRSSTNASTSGPPNNKFDQQYSEGARTPTGNCKNTLYGHFAPKNGTIHCEQFSHCLFCPSFAIVGEIDDLWRLFSYQEFLLGELHDGSKDFEGMGDKAEVEKIYRRAIRFISEYTKNNFRASIVKAARDKTSASLHPFWKLQQERSRQTRTKLSI